jgi:hypothetical protein
LTQDAPKILLARIPGAAIDHRLDNRFCPTARASLAERNQREVGAGSADAQEAALQVDLGDITFYSVETSPRELPFINRVPKILIHGPSDWDVANLTVPQQNLLSKRRQRSKWKDAQQYEQPEHNSATSSPSTAPRRRAHIVIVFGYQPPAFSDHRIHSSLPVAES